MIDAVGMATSAGSYALINNVPAKDAELVRDGFVGYRVFWERYWLSVLIAGFVLLLFLSWLRRLLFGRPQIVIRDQGKTRAR